MGKRGEEREIENLGTTHLWSRSIAQLPLGLEDQHAK